MSKVMADGKGRIKFPINEPAEGQRKSQIEEYLEFLRRPGRPAHRPGHDRHRRDRPRRCQDRGVDFLRDARQLLRGPAGARSGRSTRTSPTSHELGILADRDDEGYLLQIFTQAGRRPPDALLRGDRAPRSARLRRGELQGALRGDRARAGEARKPVSAVPPAWAGPAQAAHAVPRERPPAGRGGDGPRGLLRGTSRSSTTYTRPAGSWTRAPFEPIAHEEWVPDAHVHRHLEPAGSRRGRSDHAGAAA